MNYNKKVIWNEGMFLTPHHFQQWDRYNESLFAERLQSLSPFGWGVSDLSIDTDGLINGSFTLLSFRGILPDGLMIRTPDQDMLPETRSITELFPPSSDHLDVYLGVPVYNPGTVNYRLNDSPVSRATRFIAEYVKVPDDNTGENVREIAVARKNLKIFFTGEEMDGYIVIKIAELVRTPGGTITLRETYIPPSLTITSSSYLMRLIRGLQEVMSAKSSSLSGIQRRAAESGSSGSVDVVQLTLLQTINAYIPLLSHINNIGKVHPEFLYITLLRFTGELSIFSTSYNPADLPAYVHTDLSRTFRELDQKIRSVIEGATPVQCITIPLEKTRENVWTGRVSDERLFASSQFYLVVSGNIPEEQIREFIPKRVKAGSAHELDMIVSTAMPGVRLYYTPRPPASIPVKPGEQHFRLENHGEFWDLITRSRTISFYVPADLRGLRFELVATKE